MRLTSIVWRNLGRRKSRSVFLLAGLMVGVTTVVALLSLTDALSRRAQSELENFGANIIIAPQSEQLDLNYGGVQLGRINLNHQEIAQQSLSAIDNIPNRRNIAAIAPKVLGAVELRRQQVMLMGVDPAVEFKLKRWWSIAGRPVQQGAELVVGATVAERFELAMGDQVSLSGEPFTVVGLLAKTGSQDDQLLITPLASAQTLLNKPGQVSLVEIAALCHDCPVEDMVNQLRAVLPGTDVQAVQQVVKTRMHALGQFRLLAWGVAVTVMLIGALLVFVTMMGAVSERTREIGIYRAIGYRRSHVLQLVLVEAGAISALAGAGGYLCGVVLTLVALPLLESGQADWQWDPLLAGGAIIAAVIVGLCATLQPAFRASRMDPSLAIKSL
jgi:putative ABC transport system permease protein